MHECNPKCTASTEPQRVTYHSTPEAPLSVSATNWTKSLANWQKAAEIKVRLVSGVTRVTKARSDTRNLKNEGVVLVECKHRLTHTQHLSDILWY